MLWELYQLGRMNQVEQSARESLTKLRSNEREVNDIQSTLTTLEQQLDRLALMTIALTEIVQGRLGIGDEEIEAKLREVDERDGKIDGRFSPPKSLKTCAVCSRINGATRTNCLYCGVPLPLV